MRAVYSVPELGLGDGLLKKFVAANLSFYLKERGFNQKSFAKRLGVSGASVSAWLSGDKLPRDQYWPKILKTLDCEMEDLTRDPLGAKIKKPMPQILEADKEPIVRFLRRQANELGYDLQKLPEKHES